MTVEGPGVEQFQVEVGRTLEDRVGSRPTGEDGKECHLDAVDQTGRHQRPVIDRLPWERKGRQPETHVTAHEGFRAGSGGQGWFMSNDKAAQAREGLLDSVKGKAKEVAGAVTGKDHLVEEGQLQQAAARDRKAALADEAVADAKAEEATQAMREASLEAAEAKGAARAEAERERSRVQRQRDGEHADAAREAHQQESAGRDAAERRADELAESRLREAEAIAADADSTEQEAAAEKRRLERQAAAADQQAAQLRAQTQK